jgi:nicotinamidase-related amidase
MKTLLIIDMQKGTIEGSYHGCNYKSDKNWRSQYKQVINNIFNISKRYEKIIFLVHKEGFRKKSRWEIVDKLKEVSRNHQIIYKYQDDGYSVIKDHLTSNVHICGMNTDACVIKTALSTNKYHNVSVLEDCCYSVYATKNNPYGEKFNEGHKKALKKMIDAGIDIISFS